MTTINEKDPRGITVTCTYDRWYNHVVTEHDVMEGNEEAVRKTIQDPDEIYRSSQLPYRDVYFKKGAPSTYDRNFYTKVVTEYSGNNTATVVTAFPTRQIRGGIEDEPIYER